MALAAGLEGLAALFQGQPSLFGLGQFVSTFTITVLYVRWADREFDPRAEALHDRLEGAPQ